ncbi:MAG: hypothetical protein BZY81_03105 [SAR202 cluster bacterium Io17-Chloro-G4]|nr:MAG: hypothetical protein BZY81_03105 [SAR202 cluster bacterium Io17-Chloro-G4]
MKEKKSSKITISLPSSLLDVTDRLAKEWSTTRSGVIADLLRKESKANTEELMAQGYREWGEENLREAEEATRLTGDVVLRDG